MSAVCGFLWTAWWNSRKGRLRRTCPVPWSKRTLVILPPSSESGRACLCPARSAIVGRMSKPVTAILLTLLTFTTGPIKINGTRKLPSHIVPFPLRRGWLRASSTSGCPGMLRPRRVGQQNGAGEYPCLKRILILARRSMWGV